MSATLPGQGPATPPAEQIKLALGDVKVEKVGKVSADVMRTRRQKADLARGVHPLTRLPLRAEGGTCRACAHAVKVNGGNRDYWKCSLAGITSGAASDLRVSWPACTGFVDPADIRSCPWCEGRRGERQDVEHPWPPRKDGTPSSRKPRVSSCWHVCKPCGGRGWVRRDETS